MSRHLINPAGVTVRTIHINNGKRRIPALVLTPKERKAVPLDTAVPLEAAVPLDTAMPLEDDLPPGVLWIHGGGYVLGMKEMVYGSRAMDLVRKYGAVVVAVGYRMALRNPYPAALSDCYDALLFMKKYADELGFNRDQIFVGGESAGGGLAAALCIAARDEGEVNIAYQMPLYPMLSDIDTETSRDNHGKVWNTRRNHFGWNMYLKGIPESERLSYAAAARETDYADLPPAYTFVGDGEPFLAETLSYIKNLEEAGVWAWADVYHSDVHAFDMLLPGSDLARMAAEEFNRHFEYAMDHFYAPQDE